MYELSHGSNAPKSRFSLIQVPLIALLYGITLSSPAYVPMIITLALFLYYGSPKNERRTGIEPKTDTPIQNIPTYSLNRIDAIIMLREAQAKKRLSENRGGNT